MKDKEELINILENVIKSKNSFLTYEDEQRLIEVIHKLKNANSKLEILAALKPLAYILEIIKYLTETLSG